MNKKEQKFVTELQRWLKYNYHCTCLIEAKVVRGKTYNFKSDKSLPKEIRLLKLARETFIHKFSDASGYGTPCDVIKINQGEGFLAFKWDRRANKTFYLIYPFVLEDFIQAEHKSLSEEDAQKIAFFTGALC